VRGHEIDGIRRSHLRGDDQIALVLAILVIDQDEHPAIARFLDDLLDGNERRRIVALAEDALKLRKRVCRGSSSAEFTSRRVLAWRPAARARPERDMPPSTMSRRMRSMRSVDMIGYFTL
jgi:hypothetical protein